jgi:multiple sugar transport system permease protein
MMIFLAALQAVPQELLDASLVDGAGRWARFRHVVLPQISPAIIMVFMLMVSGSFKVFELVLLLTNGGPGVQTSVLAFEIFRQAFRLNDIGYASALSVFLFVLVIALIGIIWQFRKRMVFHEAE